MTAPVQALVVQKDDADADEDGGDPAAAVDLLFEEDFGGGGVADEGERASGGGDQAHVRVAESEEQAEEAEGHGESADEQARAGDDGEGRTEQAALCLDEVEITELAHGGGSENVSGRCSEDDGGDAGDRDGRCCHSAGSG